MAAVSKTQPNARVARPVPEITVGLAYPLGTSAEAVVSTLEQEFRRVRYEPKTIHLIELVRASPQIDPRIMDSLSKVGTPFEFGALQDAGAAFRDFAGVDGFARIGLQEMETVRKKSPLGRRDRGRAFILRSLKRPEEVNLIRRELGSSFFLVTAHSAKHNRIQRLERIIKGRQPGKKGAFYRAIAESIVKRDLEDNQTAATGQQLGKTFHLADVFVDADRASSMKSLLRRFVELAFGNSFHTPSRSEFAMYHAYAAMVRSAALPRQVGAAIASRDGTIVATGSNDVPKAGGGLYWEGDSPDGRDFVGRDFDPSDERKRRILEELIGIVAPILREDAPSSSPVLTQKETESVVDRLLAEPRFARANLNVLDVARTVHAEMDAITNAALRGVPTKECTLYTTTFPCHNCAKHIISSGLARVIYIEPYPKSIAEDLYPDSMTADPSDRLPRGRIPFMPFVGVGPRRYLDFFLAPKRTDGRGRILHWDAARAVCRFAITPREPSSGPSVA